MNVPTLATAEAAGKALFDKIGAANLVAARAVPADKISAAQGQGLGTGFWPTDDGDVLPGDQYVLYSQGKFNDTPVLIGTNSDEGALFVRGGVTMAGYEQAIRGGYGEHADAILKANPHATDAEALQASRNIFRDSAFAWQTWVWAKLQTTKGKNPAYVYYFDHRTPQSPNGASHADELPYVFRTLPPAARPEDVAMSELVSSYWTNFAKTGNPNGAGLPSWPVFTVAKQDALFLDAKSSARPLPNMQQLEALDGYYAWRRGQAQGSSKNNSR